MSVAPETALALGRRKRRAADHSGAPAGPPHTVLVQLADLTHRVIDHGLVELTIPERASA